MPRYPISPDELATLHRVYRSRHPDATEAELAGIDRAYSERERITARIALAVAVFDHSWDWPQAHRAVACEVYGLRLP